MTKYMSSIRAVRGFTLIELLVVIAIIGLLSSVVFASLNSARAKARDARRLSDLKQVQIALELYYDKYGNYPSSGALAASWPWGTYCGGWRGDNTPNNFLQPLVTEGFLPTSIDDPIPGDCKFQYRSIKPNDANPGQGYTLVVALETIPNTNLTCYNSATWYCVGVNYP